MYHEESQIQIACVRWFYNQHGDLEGLLFAVPNGGRRGKVEAGIMKAEGVYAGVADIAKATAGVFDWKDGKGESAGTKAQDWMHLVPQLVHGDEGNMTLAYGQIALLNTVLLARHEDEQDKEIKELKEKIKELEDKVRQLTTN